MDRYDQQLSELRRQMDEQARLNARLPELYQQWDALTAAVPGLAKAAEQAQKQADRRPLFRRSGEQEEQAQREAHTAAAKHGEAVQSLAAVEEELRSARARLEALEGCQQKYDALLSEKAGALRSAGGPAANELRALDGQIAGLEAQEAELAETVACGNEVLRLSSAITACLNQAEKSGWWDILGADLIPGVEKHNALKDAKADAAELKSVLERFQTRLAGTGEQGVSPDQADISVSFGGADLLMDNRLVDFVVQDEIIGAQGPIRDVTNRTAAVLDRLKPRLEQLQAELAAARARRDGLTAAATL